MKAVAKSESQIVVLEYKLCTGGSKQDIYADASQERKYMERWAAKLIACWGRECTKIIVHASFIFSLDIPGILLDIIGRGLNSSGRHALKCEVNLKRRNTIVSIEILPHTSKRPHITNIWLMATSCDLESDNRHSAVVSLWRWTCYILNKCKLRLFVSFLSNRQCKVSRDLLYPL